MSAQGLAFTKAPNQFIDEFAHAKAFQLIGWPTSPKMGQIRMPARRTMRNIMRMVAHAFPSMELILARCRFMWWHRVLNQCGSYLLECGITMRVGAGVFETDLPHILTDEHNERTSAMRVLLTDLWRDFNQLEGSIISLS